MTLQLPEDLALLAEDDPYRTTPLITIGAYYKQREAKYWAEVTSAYTIAKQLTTYNDLGESWRIAIWKATIKIA